MCPFVYNHPLSLTSPPLQLHGKYQLRDQSGSSMSISVPHSNPWIKQGPNSKLRCERAELFKGRLSKWIRAEFPHIQLYNELLFLPWWGLSPVQEHVGHTRVFTLISGTQMCLGIQHLPSKSTRGIIIWGKLCLTESSTSFEVLSPFFSCNGFMFKMHMVLLWINKVK